MEQFDKIPGADIQHDGSKGRGDNRTFQKDRPHISMAIGVPDNEEDKSKTEQMNV